MNTKGVRVKAIAKATDGFSGAELKATCVEAGMIAIRSSRDTVVQSDVTKAVERINKKNRNLVAHHLLKVCMDDM